MSSIRNLVARVPTWGALPGLVLLGTVIALALSYEVVAAVPDHAVRAVSYAGTTSQHAGRYGVQRLPSNQLSFTVAKGAVRNFSIPWVAPCQAATLSSTDPLLERTLITDALPVRRGRFSATATYEFSPGPHQTASVEQFRLVGRLKGRRASGTLSINSLITLDKAGAVSDCRTTHPIRWSTVAGGSQRSRAFPALGRPQQMGYIAYTVTPPTTGTSTIWLANKTDGSAVQVTHPPPGASDTGPALSLANPGGPALLTYERTVAGVSQIYVADPFDKPIVTIKTGFPGGGVTNFPGGAHEPAIAQVALGHGTIVFSVGSGADCSLWVSDESGKLRRLTNHGGSPGCDSAPTWSPDDKSIAFHRELTDAAGVPTGGTNMVVSAAGGTPRALAVPSSVTAFSWAPGRKLVFLSPGATGTPCLQAVNPDGSGPQTILCDGGLTGRPAWAPNRDAIAVVERQADGSTDIATVSAAGGAPVALTNTPGVSEESPTWTGPPVFGAGAGQPGPGVHARPQRPGR
ncbi:MAG: hypothetical protein M3065_10590 [Actinomycetota bacterium]|nr:hypothetical protein [Actinomycetota bacterium]